MKLGAVPHQRTTTLWAEKVASRAPRVCHAAASTATPQLTCTGLACGGDMHRVGMSGLTQCTHMCVSVQAQPSDTLCSAYNTVLPALTSAADEQCA